MDFNLRYITGDVAQSGRAHGFHEAGGSNPPSLLILNKREGLLYDIKKVVEDHNKQPWYRRMERISYKPKE